MNDDQAHEKRRALPAPDSWIDSLLRDDAAAAVTVADDGFTAALIAGLPARPERSRYRWIVPAMSVVGFVVGLLFLWGGEDLSLMLAGLAQARSLSLRSLLLAALPLGVLYWIAFGAAWQEA